MNPRGWLYLAAHRAMGSQMPVYYLRYRKEDRTRLHSGIANDLLRQMLIHCSVSVPYYRDIIRERDISLDGDPAAALARLPTVTKDTIRAQWDHLKSDDLSQRSWHFNTSGGSTGEPIKLIQDDAHNERVVALQQLYSFWAGAEIGDRQIAVWGSEREILQGRLERKVTLANLLTDRTILNAFGMTDEKMRRFIHTLNSKRPKVIIAYAQAMYELARFVERERLTVRKQRTIITSAGTLYPFMRDTIQRVFDCTVFNRYGSREVGDIAGECQVHDGLHVLPWGSYVEIVDDEGERVPPGTEGRITVTCLTNYAMPLIRYDIGDRGALSPVQQCACGRTGQRLLRVAGRTVDTFTNADGVLIDGEYFTHLLYFRGWVQRFQVVQSALDQITYRIVRTELTCPEGELEDIKEKTLAVMGRDCAVQFEFVQEIAPTASGKYRYTISLVTS